MKKFIYTVIAASLVFSGISANAAPAAKKTTTVKKTTAAKKATPAPKVKKVATSKYVFPTHTLNPGEQMAVKHYMNAFNSYSEGKLKLALSSLDMCDKSLGYASPRSSYLRAKINYDLSDYPNAAAAAKAYLDSKPVKDKGYAEIVTINDQLSSYFSQQQAQKNAADSAAAQAAAQAVAQKKAEKEKLQNDIEAARLRREEARKNMGQFVAKIDAELDEVRAKNTREAYQEFLQKYAFGRARVTAEKEMLAKWPYPNRTLKNGKYGYTDASGKFVVKAKYDNAAAYEEGMARVGLAGKYGFVNEQGKEIVPVKFKSASNYSYGYAAVKEVNNGPAYFIDKAGAKLANKDYKDVQAFSEGMAAVSDGKLWGYVDKTGNLTIKNQFNVAKSFSFGRAVVGKKVGNAYKYAFVKKDGTMLTDFVYDEAQNFQNGVARVKVNGKYGLIDFVGAPVTVCAYDYITEFRADGYARARRNGVEVLLDRNGDNFSEVKGNIIPVTFKN